MTLSTRQESDMFGGSLKTLEAIREQRFPSTHSWERRVFFNKR